MLATTHFVATTTILLLADSAGLGVSKNVIILSYLLGNLVDLDHFILYPQRCWYFIKGFFKTSVRNQFGKYYLRSIWQEPWVVLVLLFFSAFVYNYTDDFVVFLPVIVLGIHISMDAVMEYDNRLLWPFCPKKIKGFIPSNTTFEYVMSIFLGILLLYLAFKQRLFHF